MKGWTLLLYTSASMMASAAGALTLPPLTPRGDAPICASNATDSPCPQGARFCCPALSSCLFSTPNNDSVLCCPNGQDCTTIRTISCDIQQQNATSNPLSAVQTTNLGAKLDTCGNGCCPLGFTCKGGAMCTLEDTITNTGSSQTPSPSSASSTTVPVLIPTSTSPPPVVTVQAAPHSNPFPAGAIVLGLFLGLLIGAALTVLALWLVCRRRKSRPGLKRQPSSPSFMGRTPRDMAHDTIRPSFVADTPAPVRPPPLGSSIHSRSASNVSEPMWSENLLQAPPHRTDFLLRRGSCETGYEAANKPNWSAKDSQQKTSPLEQGETPLGRGRSRRILDLSHNNASDGVPPQMTTKSTRQPLFIKPLKLDGKAVRPEPRRPPRSDEQIPQTLHVGGSHMRDDSQSRTLVAHDSLASAPKPAGLTRSNSDSDHSAIDDDDDSPMTRHASGETINVMLTPEPAAAAANADLRRETTFSDIMRKAGWKKGSDGRF